SRRILARGFSPRCSGRFLDIWYGCDTVRGPRRLDSPDHVRGAVNAEETSLATRINHHVFSTEPARRRAHRRPARRRSPATRRGIEYLTSAKRNGNKWEEPRYTAVGFPRVFFLRYDGYSRYFPIWALARYKNLMNGNSKNVSYGM
ncbi:MAG: hypothetical protein IIA70_06985, partial [Proteobacteria bacterium]|nr:hypothetical protein [Pseudomonadota bacterium]